MRNKPSIAVVGATGAVGREMVAVLEQRDFPHSSLRLFASPRSAGETIPFKGRPVKIEASQPGCLKGIDIALFSAGSAVSKDLAPSAAAAGTIVIDNSSAFRMDDGVPLVIPEVNPEALAPIKTGRGGIIANPNCSAIIMLVALTPLRKAFGIEQIIVSTYQAASGAGAKGMAELEKQTRAALDGRSLAPEFFHEPYAFNLFSHNTAVDPESGLNVEERKMIDETRKIWNDPSVRLSPTCIRVPVLRAHSESINVRLRATVTAAEVRAVLSGAKGVRVMDDRAANRFPTPLKASGGDDVLVGRIRPSPSAEIRPDGKSSVFDLFVAGDQLRKGAALNAVQLAETVNS